MSREHQIRINTNDATANVDKLSKALDRNSSSLENAKNKAESFAKQTNNVQKVSAGTLGTLQAVAGAMTLFGKDTSSTTQIMAKFASVMAITNGLKAFGEGVKSSAIAQKLLATNTKLANTELKGFRTALAGTGIGLLVIALGELITHWDMVKEKIFGVTEEHKKLNEEIDNTKKAYDSLSERLLKLTDDEKYEIDMMTAQGKSKEEILRKEISLYEKRTASIQSAIDTQQRLYDRASTEEERKYYQDNISYYKEQQRQIQRVIDLKQTSLNTSGTTTTKDDELKKVLDEQNRLREESLNYIENAKGIIQEEIDKELILKKIEEERLQNHIKANEESLKLMESLKEQSYIDEDEQADTEEFLASNLKLYRRLDLEMKKAAIDSGKVWDTLTDTDKIAAVNEAVSSFGQGFSDLFSAIASSMDENSEEYKALMVTQTVITTLTGMMNAVSSAMSPNNAWMTLPGQIAMAATTSASVLATGIATIVQMQNASENSSISSSSISSSTSISPNAVNQISSPEINRSLTSSLDSTTDTKVYVTETDITKTQNKRKTLRTQVKF